MSHLFSLTPSVKVQRSSFDRSHTYKTTFDAGKLIPFFVDEVLPGDSLNLKASLFCRMSTPIVPIMDNLYLETFFFFVPNRLLWNNWERFLGAQDDPGDSIDYLTPEAAATGVQNQSLLDYFGIPTGLANQIKFNALPIRAYFLIWNEWFRSENLQNSVKIAKGDTGVIVAGSSLPTGFTDIYLADSAFPRGKRHDYFTSCTIAPQKFEALSIPLTGNAPVFGNGMTLGLSDGDPARYASPFDESNPNSPALNISVSLFNQEVGYPLQNGSSSFNSNRGIGVVSKDQLDDAELDYSASGLYADLSAVTAATINDLRTAFQIQRLLESQNRSGTRIKEILLGQFGVLSPDSRLQLPEYLGGSSKRININPVMQTSSTDSTTPQGNLAAYGVCADKFNGFVKSFTEHGWVIGLVNVRADLTYQQGLNRMWSRRTRYDYYWPTLAHLGEQAVLNKEIYMQGTDDDEGVFGYQERWSEYRYYPNMITGKFRSTDSQSLDIWHLGQKFDSLPQLNYEFIQDDPPVDRVIAVPSEPQFFLDVYFKQNSVRPMPVYSIPGLIDHF